MLTAESGLANWEGKLLRNWANFQYLTILSWHNAKGDITDTTTATNPSILKPIQDSKRDDCLSAGIKFVRVHLELDYFELAMTPAGPPASNPVLCGEYYIQLPQATKDLANERGTPHRLSTYLGGNDIRSLSAEEVKHTILDVTYQDVPYNLLAPSFNLMPCRTNSSGIYSVIKSMVVHLALDTIHNTSFMVLVPGYSIEPQHILDHIWQSYVDTNSKTVELSMQVYYTNFMNAIQSFCDLKEYPVDLDKVFQDHMNPSMQKSFCMHYPTFGATHSCNAITQRSILMDMLTAHQGQEQPYQYP
jgi:hypothetical protein